MWHIPSLHASLSILIMDFILIFIFFDNGSWQNISKVKWRRKGSRLFKRDPPSLLETILFQNGFCYRVGHLCFFLGLLCSARQVWHPSSHTCFFFHSVVSSSYMVSLPLITWRWCPSCPGTAVPAKAAVIRQLPAPKLPGCPLLRAKTWQCFIFNWWPWFAHLPLNLWALGDSCWLHHSPSWGTLEACSEKLFPSLGVGE